MWIAALNAVALPSVAFANDAWLFCARLSPPEFLLYTVNTIFGILCSVLGPSWFDVLDIYHFYQLPLAFTWRLYLLLCGFMLLYVIALYSIDRIRKWYEQHHRNAIVPSAM